MARGVNKWIGIGHLGGDPNTRYLPSGAAVSAFSIAVTETWKDKQTGEQKERTEWVNIETWGKLAEVCAQYLTKGQQVYIEGKLQTDEWEDKESGQKRYKTKVRADTMQMLGGGGDRGSRPAPAKRQQQEPDEQKDFDDDIPFD